MKLQEMAPKDLIESAWLDAYEENIEALWWQLVRLNSSIFVLDKVLSFPFDLFQPSPVPRHFWNLVQNALFETCVMVIWRVAVDNRSEGLTLQQLKNKIRENLCKEDYREQFGKTLKKVDFEKGVSTFRPKIEELRHNYIAHFNLVKNVNPTPEQIKQRSLLVSEVREYNDALKRFFRVLCFGRQRELLPAGYHLDVIHPVGSDGRSDIEKLLDNVAKDSPVLNMPERDPDYWLHFSEGFSEQEVETFNGYRVKFGLPEV